MCMINLLPFISLQVHCYPVCVEEVRPRYRPRGGREAANDSCSTVLLFTLWICTHALKWKINILARKVVKLFYSYVILIALQLCRETFKLF